MKLAQNLGQLDPQKRRYGLFAGCFLVSLAYLSMSKPYPTPIPTVNSQISSIHAALTTSPSLEDITNSRQSDCNGAHENRTQKSKLRCNVSNPQPDLDRMVDVNMMPKNSSISDPSPQGKDANNAQQLESNNKMETSQISDEPKSFRYEMGGDTEVPENSSAKAIVSTEKVEARDSKQLESTNKMEKSLIPDGPKSVRYEIDGDTRVRENSSAKAIDSIERLEARDSKQLESTDKMEKSQMSDDPKSVRYGLIDSNTRVLENSSAKAIDSTERLEARDSKQLEVRSEDVKPETKLMCDFSDIRSDVCEMDGDIRIIGKFSSVIFLTSSQMGDSERKESWRIRPYARKSDRTAMANVREVFLKSSDGNEAPRCTVNHSIPAIVFSDAGFTGNYFHDFSDVLVPLFQTSHQFNGEVQFLVTNFRYWWIHKYLPIFKMLSRYEIIDFDNDDRVHCFPRTIVGLRSNRDLNIDPSRSPEGYSMAEFAKFMRNAYSLERDSLVRMRKVQNRKPRLLIIARGRTRRFTNLDKIVRMARKLGYEVEVAENDGGSDVAQFAHIVNSCDVMMGVHGAGLTNLVFLPTNAILIQIVPWGSLDWIAGTYFREPAKEMKLRYLEYSISQDESTLKKLYPRDHPVFKDTMSIHKLGWNAMGDIYLVKQNVQLNVRRFRGVLSKALKLLYQ